MNKSNKVEDFTKAMDTIRKQGGNKECFDCGQKVNTNYNH
jgi:hypothetical protein